MGIFVSVMGLWIPLVPGKRLIWDFAIQLYFNTRRFFAAPIYTTHHFLFFLISLANPHIFMHGKIFIHKIIKI